MKEWEKTLAFCVSFLFYSLEKTFALKKMFGGSQYTLVTGVCSSCFWQFRSLSVELVR